MKIIEKTGKFLKKQWPLLLSYALCGALFTGAAMAANDAMKKPDVHVSYSTGECVKVVHYDSPRVWTCDKLPPVYFAIWME